MALSLPIRTDQPDQMWGTDATATLTVAEGAVTVFATIDHSTAECIGIHAVKKANRFEALEPVREAVTERFGDFSRTALRVCGCVITTAANT
jgi:putative transposase